MTPWDTRVRLRAFEWLDEIIAIHGDILPRTLLQKGFDLAGQRIPLVAPNGIFTPRGCDYPLTITTIANGPYPDRFDDEHRLAYRYRGRDPGHRDNVGLRHAMRDDVPLIYLYGVAKGRYLAIKPVYVTADNPTRLTFTVMADVVGTYQGAQASAAAVADPEQARLRREYATYAAQHRVHQKAFRERVLDAYRTHCAMCHLKHRELLDAAHIIPDVDPEGQPATSNGLSLCKIHHTAFDRGILGIRPDYVIEVREDILNETDGPMLKYGLQALHGSSLLLPRRPDDRPSQKALDRRYQIFAK